MPELPEVTTIVRELNDSHVFGTKILTAIVYCPSIIETPFHHEFCRKIVGQIIVKIERRGKFLVFSLNNETLLVHLRMTGKFTLFSPEEERRKHEHVRLILSDGRALCYEDARKFGRWYLLKDPNIKLEKIGLEPLSEEFTFEALWRCIKKRKSLGCLKAFLLNQSFVCGIGNIYADEALWEAKLHPLRSAKDLSKEEVLRLYEAIPKVLRLGIANKGTSLGSGQANYYSVSGRRGKNQYQLNVFRQDGNPCPRCQNNIIKMKVAQRGTHVCPFCQML